MCTVTRRFAKPRLLRSFASVSTYLHARLQAMLLFSVVQTSGKELSMDGPGREGRVWAKPLVQRSLPNKSHVHGTNNTESTST
ncbi:hypothetical protein K504DRAFT_273416 [Pleomassaria siparia CBS 279.74]|uniref:Uncharacterized protein n=1 Tax=Pleomassaria siparia CBS 279.74 TaxID=1314801 RepID=A0A6G1KAK0_9PLEO|nr:hypothetical protein K504DRAFT_273416 [Pleomassaria siparia CBS 279.74]